MARAARRKISTPSRPYWAGLLRLSLVTLPINVFRGLDSSSRSHFHQIHEPTGRRVQYQKIVSGVGPVPSDEIVKGFEYEKDKYIVLERDELKALRMESAGSFTIARFVDRSEIDAIYFDEPYFVGPAEESAIEGFAVVRDALRATRKVGLGQIVLSGRERIAALQPCGRGLLMETLRYADEIKSAEQFFAVAKDAKADKDQLELARRLIEQKSGAFEPEQFKDHYEESVRELLDAKLKGHSIIETEKPRKSAEIIDLMDALKRSVKRSGDSDAKRAPKTSKARKPKRAAARR